MNIYAEPGDRVVFVGASDAQVLYGHGDDPRPFLKIGVVYVVEYIVVRDFYSQVKLEGYDGQFNSAHFEDAESYDALLATQ